MNDVADAKTLAAERWFGYGRWSAPYWFVGMEPGGKDADASYEKWLELGGHELIDCREHHLQSGCKRWHVGDRPPTQTTWRGLIRVLLTIKNEPADIETVSRYQRDSLGAGDGESALIELSALHARNLRESEAHERYLHRRVSLIKQRLREVQRPPRLALFYGQVYRKYYEVIAGSFGSDYTCWLGETLCVLAPSPAAPRYRSKPEYWINMGVTIRDLLISRSVEERPEVH